MNKVGIFSGTFDPVHNGHLQFARDAIRRFDLDKVFIMVEPNPRRKQGVKSFVHRQKMAQLAVENNSKLGTIILEQDRFTVDETLPVLRARFEGAKIYMLMGDDMLSHLSDWPNVDHLLRSLNFIIGVRQDEELARQRLETIQSTRGISVNYSVIRSSRPGVSSSQVRQALRSGESVNDIPPGIQRYIQEQGLYISVETS